jgi:hypothetical protein
MTHSHSLSCDAVDLVMYRPHVNTAPRRNIAHKVAAAAGPHEESKRRSFGAGTCLGSVAVNDDQLAGRRDVS